MKKEYWILLVITTIGLSLRLWNNNAFWYDEAFFGMTIRDNIWKQEYTSHFIAWLFGLNTDFGLRFMSVIFGTLSIPAIYFVLKEYKWIGVLFVAFNPLFIFWSDMARPYAIAGFFCILGWRWWWFYIPAIINCSIFTIPAFRGKKKVVIPLILFTLLFYVIRPDVNSGNWFQYLGITFLSGRLWYLPLIALTLWVCDYFLPFAMSLQANKLGGYFIIGALCVFFVLPNQTWYRQDVRIFSNWKDCGRLDFATEYNNAAWYGGDHPLYFQIYQQKKVDSLLRAGDTLRIGLGQLTTSSCFNFMFDRVGRAWLDIPKNAHINKKFLNEILTDTYSGRETETSLKIRTFWSRMQRLAMGDVIKVKLWLKDNKYYNQIY